MPINYSKYPKNWKTEIVPKIRERSGDKCEHCGLDNGQMVWSYKLETKVEVEPGKIRYKVKTFWTESESDLKRLEAIQPMIFDIKKVNVVLTTAHLDHDEENENISLDRLMHLCQYCHLNYDAKEKFRRKAKV